MNDLIMKNSGGIPSPYDPRDWKLDVVASASLPSILPLSCVLDISLLPVWMQNKLGACVGHAWGKSQQYCEYIETGKVSPLSARFIYALSKCLDGYTDEGTYPRITAQVMKNYGIATEATCPNDTTLPHADYVYQSKIENVPKEALSEAQKVKIAGYAFSDNTPEALKQAIYYAKTKRQGVVMLLKVGNSFWTDAEGNVTWDKNKILPLRAPSQVSSGHEVFPYAYEYINGRLAIHFLNSWSKDWADNGTGWFYYDEWQDYIVEVMTSIDASDIPHFQFTKALQIGMTDPDVLQLQKALNKLGFPIAQTGPGSAGHETAYFGTLTQNAVRKFQGAKSLPTTGYFGPMSIKVMNPLI